MSRPRTPSSPSSIVGLGISAKSGAERTPRGLGGTNSQAFPGPAQFQVRTPEAILHLTHGGLRIGVDCSTDGPWADCGLHFGRPA
eukprot:11168496-Alexandrium_andersonii.AAC.1